jgi:hypothetical protein
VSDIPNRDSVSITLSSCLLAYPTSLIRAETALNMLSLQQVCVGGSCSHSEALTRLLLVGMSVSGIIYIWVTFMIQQLLLLLPGARQAGCTRVYVSTWLKICQNCHPHPTH